MSGSYIDEDDVNFMNLDLKKKKKVKNIEDKKIHKKRKITLKRVQTRMSLSPQKNQQLQNEIDDLDKVSVVKYKKKNVFKDFIEKELKDQTKRFDKKKKMNKDISE